MRSQDKIGQTQVTAGQESSPYPALLAALLFSLAFTGLIAWAGTRLQTILHLPDQGAAWYYWRLPLPTAAGRLSAWGLYLAHQISMWGLIYYGQTRLRRYTASLHPINRLALIVNGIFIVLHFIQTHLWYDGLAQDVSIFTSQGSVIVLLVWVLLMENPRRGLFFGKRVPFPQNVIGFARRYHGYFFAWATIYTFWYHPMESTSGHLVGFAYMFLLMIQGSLFFTRLHISRRWTLVQEVAVLLHGTLVAVMQGNQLWPMFAFGFGGVFIITQMHGLGLERWKKGLIAALYGAAALYAYSLRGWGQLNEIIRIPVIDYLAVFVLAGLIAMGLGIHRRLQPSPHRLAEGRLR
jgi:hypothetical protein